MKIRVISLKSRKDRKEKFEEANRQHLEGLEWSYSEAINGSNLTLQSLNAGGFDTDKNWRDPLLNRVLTKGEIGCFLSHYKLWEECSEGDEPMLILEDDAVLSEAPDASWAEGGITYLTHKEMLPGGVKDNFVCYPYWTAAYVVSPSAALALTDTDIDQNIIPVDEYLPRMTDRLCMTSLPKAKQRNRSEVGSDVEPKSHAEYFIDFEVHNLTCHDNDAKAVKLLQTNPKVKNILEGRWRGGTMVGPGGGQKLNCLKQAIADLPDHDVVVFTDAFDVFYARPVEEVVGRFLEAKTGVLLAAEQYLWPDKSLRFPPVETPYRYLNSGCLVGRVGELKRILSSPIEDHEDDQLYLQRKYLSGLYKMELDTEHYVFMTHDEGTTIKRGMPFNPKTKCFGCVYHGNGGAEAKAKFERLYSACFPEKEFANLSVSDYTVIGPEMILVDFLSPSQCEEWIRIGDEHGGWNPHPHDKFPSHDIHLKELGLWDGVSAWWDKVAARVFESYWRPTRNYHLRKAFLMKYSDDTQKTLGLHNDASMVTGSVKLNDDYEDATLIFPRQDITNKDIPIGKMILFPGQVTHGHHVDQLTSGTKYSATFWSARYDGDYLDPN